MLNTSLYLLHVKYSTACVVY